MDKDHSDSLSREEVTGYMKAGHHLMTKTEKKEIIEELKEGLAKEFARLDKNSDGVLSGEERKSEETRSLRRSKQDSNQKDMNLDQFVVYKNPALESDHSQYAKFLTLDMMDEWDKNEDGKLSYDEYDAWQAKNRADLHKWEKTEDPETGGFTISVITYEGDAVDKKDEHDKDFKAADKDGNGELDEPELFEYMKSKGGIVWEAEADDFFMYVDADKNSFITLKELQNAKYLNPVTSLHALTKRMQEERNSQKVEM